MFERLVQTRERIIALVLAIVMVLSLIPLQNFATLAADELGNEEEGDESTVFSFKVQDSDGNGISGARVILQEVSESTDETSGETYLEEATTDNNGVAK